MLSTTKTTLFAVGLLLSFSGPGLASETPYLGVTLTMTDDTTTGVFVEDVAAGGPAAKAGLRKADRILSFNGEKTPTSAALVRLLRATNVGDSVAVSVDRRARVLEFSLKLASHPRPPARPAVRPPAPAQVPAGPYTGLKLIPVEGHRELHVVRVAPGSPAAEAGLQSRDDILAINGRAPRGMDEYQRLLRKSKPGDVLRLLVDRDGWTSRVSLKVTGTALPRPTPYSGMELLQTPKGLVVLRVTKGSPAAKAGLKDRDTLLTINGQAASLEDYTRVVRKSWPGDVLGLHVSRDGWTKSLELTLTARE